MRSQPLRCPAASALRSPEASASGNPPSIRWPAFPADSPTQPAAGTSSTGATGMCGGGDRSHHPARVVHPVHVTRPPDVCRRTQARTRVDNAWTAADTPRRGSHFMSVHDASPLGHPSSRRAVPGRSVARSMTPRTTSSPRVRPVSVDHGQTAHESRRAVRRDTDRRSARRRA